MRMTRILLALMFAVSSTHSLQAWALAQDQATEKILLDTAGFLNSLKSVGQMVTYMKATASAEDKEYFDSLDGHVLTQKIPRADVDVKKKILYFKGLKPLKVLDVAAGKYSYDEREFTFDPKQGAEKVFESLERVIFPKAKNAFFQLLIPSAQAMGQQQKGMLMGVFDAMGIMGMLACFSGQQGQKPANQQNEGSQQPAGQGANPACMMGFAGLLGMFIAMGIKTDDAKEVKCTVTSAGVRTAQVIGPNGRVLSSTQGLPGQYVTAPAIAGPVNYGPQLMQICGNQTALGSINQALAAPPILPPAPAMQKFVNQAPPGSKPVVKTQSLKPQDRKPAESGDARFLDPGAGAR